MNFDFLESTQAAKLGSKFVRLAKDLRNPSIWKLPMEEEEHARQRGPVHLLRGV